MRALRLAAATFRSLLAVGLALMLAAQPAFALDEKELPNAPMPAAEPQALTITILDGEGALNNIRQRTAREPIIQVTDQNHKPVAGALVVFTVSPGSGGASASFSGASSLRVQTDSAGRAVGHGLVNNGERGEYTISVVATQAALTALATIHQTNGTPPATVSSNPNPRRILKWTIVGGAIVIGILVGIYTNNGGSGTRITVGGGGVGPP